MGKDLIGQRFGKLTAIKRLGLDKHRHSIWLFKCDCGNEYTGLLQHVKKGEVASCGCVDRRYKDFSGQRFGRLIAIERVGADQIGKTLWLFKCDCGNECVIRIADVVSGNTRSCGCLHDKQDGLASENRRLYNVWSAMKKRCYDKKSNAYKNYGAKGVQVCNEWLSFSNFVDWAKKSGYDEKAPRGECTIDRIDPFGNYEPGNCRWVDMKTQNQNKRKRYAAEIRELLGGDAE